MTDLDSPNTPRRSEYVAAFWLLRLFLGLRTLLAGTEKFEAKGS
jgi:thiosulfate dehydrogenase [quinone] large subunit